MNVCIRIYFVDQYLYMFVVMFYFRSVFAAPDNVEEISILSAINI